MRLITSKQLHLSEQCQKGMDVELLKIIKWVFNN